jgi:hypothetical protein
VSNLARSASTSGGFRSKSCRVGLTGKPPDYAKYSEAPTTL